MAKYRLGDIAPVSQGMVADNDQYWLLNLDVVESNTGKVLEYVYVDYSQIGASTVSFDQTNVLYSKLRPYLNKVVIPDRAGYATSEMLPLKPNEQVITRKYLTYFLRSPHFVEYINGKTSGAKMPRANIADLKSIEIECPPIMNQNRITSQFDLITTIIDNRKKELSAFDDLIKARFVEVFKQGYPEDSLLNLCNIIDYRGKTPEKVESGLPFITAKNIKMHKMSMEPREYISKETYDKVMVRGFPKEGDVVFTTEAPLGNVCRIPHFDTEFYIGQRIVTLQTEKLIPAYLEYAVSTEDFKRKYMEKSSGSTVTGIRVRLLEKLTIPVPPIELQKQFADFVNQVDKSKFSGRVCNSKYKLVLQLGIDKIHQLFYSLIQEFLG